MILHLIRRAYCYFISHSSEGDGYGSVAGYVIAVILGGTLCHHDHPMPYPFPRVSIVAAPTVPIVLHLYFHHLCHPTSSALPSSAAVSADLFMCSPHHPEYLPALPSSSFISFVTLIHYPHCTVPPTIISSSSILSVMFTLTQYPTPHVYTTVIYTLYHISTDTILIILHLLSHFHCITFLLLPLF